MDVRLLGPVAVILDGRRLRAFDSIRLQRFLALIALRDDLQHRSRLAFELWPDSSERQARTNLRKLLHELRNALPDIAEFVEIGKETVRWLPAGPSEVDVLMSAMPSPRAISIARCGCTGAVVTAEAQLDRGKGVEGVTRVDGVPTGAYRVEFDEPIGDCAWTAVAGSAPEALTPIFGSFSLLLNQQANNAVGVFVFQNSANPVLQDTPFHLAVHRGADEEQEEEPNGSSNGPPSNGN